MTPDQLDELCPDWRERETFLCGPAGLLEAMGERWRSDGDPRRACTSSTSSPTRASATASAARAARSASAASGIEAVERRRAADPGRRRGAPARSCRSAVAWASATAASGGCARARCATCAPAASTASPARCFAPASTRPRAPSRSTSELYPSKEPDECQRHRPQTRQRDRRRRRAREPARAPHAEQIEQLGREFDAIHDEVYADLGERDSRYIRSTIKLHRQLVLAARALLLGSRYQPLWLAGTAALSLAKILENMEIGHNVMHGQWDWMNDPDINSQSWDWDTASPADAWRHSHNYEHHTFTNIRGKDRDLGYEIMRIDPHQNWHPVYLFQPLYNLMLMGFFEWGVARARPQLRRDPLRREVKGAGARRAEGDRREGARQIVKDYVAFPALAGSPRSLGRGSATLSRRPTSRRTSCATCGRTRSSSAGTSPTRPTPSARRRSPRRRAAAGTCASCSARRTSTAARCSTCSRGNLSFQVEHHLYPGHALQPLRRDRPARARHLPPLRPALQHRAAAQAARHASTARSCAWHFPAARCGPSRAPYRPA